jgi:hypothetical protein
VTFIVFLLLIAVAWCIVVGAAHLSPLLLFLLLFLLVIYFLGTHSRRGGPPV